MVRRCFGSRRQIAVIVFLVAVFALTIGGCGSESSGTVTSEASQPDSTEAVTSTSGQSSTPSSVSAEPRKLTVSAASSLKVVFTEIAAAFDEAGGSETTINFDASGTLQKQIEAGAPVDVFASAALKQVNALLQKKLLDEATVKNFAGNEIVLAVPVDSSLGIATFEDLTKPLVEKVTYGDPKAAPHGVAAEEILNFLGIFEQVKPKVIYAANVSQTLEYVSSGEVDAGIMFITEAMTATEKVKLVATSEPGWHSEIVYPIAVVSEGKDKTLAQAFVDFVMGAGGQSILQKHGFLSAPTG